MTKAMRDEEGGQAIIIVAFGALLLMSAMAFVVDWGHGLALRRVSQNEADAAALAAGRMLATSVDVGGRFMVGTDEVCAEALRHATQNATIGANASWHLVVSFISVVNGSTVESNAVDSKSCASGGAVPANTIYVRVRAETKFRSFVGALLQSTDSLAGASARVRITGVPVATQLGVPGAPRHGVSGAASDGPIVWPLTRHFDPRDFQNNEPLCGTCDPRDSDYGPLRFLDQSNRYGKGSTAFFGLLEPSRSSRFDVTATQLLTASDQTGPKRSLSPACPAGSWDTSGKTTSTDCNVANWFGYGFGGMLALDSSWKDQPDQSLKADRLACNDAQDINSQGGGVFLPVFSCAPGSPSVGDWVETATGRMTGDPRSEDIAALVGELIVSRGQKTVYSDELAPNGQRYGKALVVRIFLWDCAQQYDTSAKPPQWKLITSKDDEDCDGECSNNGSGDCSMITTKSVRPDRVHLLTVVPFTFYQGLVTPTQIRAFWGDAFSDPGSCRLAPQPASKSCPPINPAANSAFLVPDD